MTAVTINHIMSEIALTHFLFAGLTITVAVNVLGPGFQARYGALEIPSSTDNPRLQSAAFEQYQAANELIAAGTQLIQVNKSVTELAKAFQTVGKPTVDLAEAYNKGVTAAQDLPLTATIERLRIELGSVDRRFEELRDVIGGQSYIDVKNESTALDKSQDEVLKLILKILEKIKF
jgi:hypothetical protein